MSKKAEKSPPVVVEIITERKILEVHAGMLSGTPDRVLVDVCTKCAAIVFDPVEHFKWHVAVGR